MNMIIKELSCLENCSIMRYIDKFIPLFPKFFMIFLEKMMTEYLSFLALPIIFHFPANSILHILALVFLELVETYISLIVYSFILIGSSLFLNLILTKGFYFKIGIRGFKESLRSLLRILKKFF